MQNIENIFKMSLKFYENMSSYSGGNRLPGRPASGGPNGSNRAPGGIAPL